MGKVELESKRHERRVSRMAKKRNTKKGRDRANGVLSKDPLSKDLWIADRYSLKGPAGERAWENRPGSVPNNSRFLELADIALGTKKSVPLKKNEHLASAHDRRKTEPYSNK